MSDTFQTRIPTLPDAELEAYLAQPGRYKREAVEAALAELRRRGMEPSGEILERVRTALEAGRAQDAPEATARRERLVLAGILITGLGSALVLYFRAAASRVVEYDLHPEDSKTYIRQMEVIGGKANLLGAQFMSWFGGLWQGTHLAATVACLTLIAAAGYGCLFLYRP